MHRAVLSLRIWSKSADVSPAQELTHPRSGRKKRGGNKFSEISCPRLPNLLLVVCAVISGRAKKPRAPPPAAMQDASGDDRRIDSIKKQLASEIAMHLFVKPIDPNGAANYIGGDSAGNRIQPGMYSVRYGVESASKTAPGTGGDQLSNVVDPSKDPASNSAIDSSGADNFPDGYNFAPYSVIPWTNWPDFLAPTKTVSGTRFIVKGEANGNPLGNPGFGDTRWLRSTEPVRIDKNGLTNRVATKFKVPKIELNIPGGFSPNNDGIDDAWFIKRPFGTKISVQVFNRWGNEVYANDNYMNDWRGKGVSNFMGEDVVEGTYFYIVLATDMDGIIKKFAGSLTIVR